MPAALDNRIDWHDAYEKWILARSEGKTLTDFAKEYGRDRGYLALKFKEMQMSMIKEKMASIVEKGVNVLDKTINENDSQLEPDFVLKATTQLADRIGLSPQSQQINVQNNVAIGISLVPREDAEEIKSMLGGEIVQSDSHD